MPNAFERFFANRIHAFCAFCKSQRKVYRKKRIGLGDIASCALGAAATTGLAFGEVDARGIFFFVAYLAIAEVFIQFRWRMGVVCPHCGFDPVLYMRDPSSAARKVTAHLDRRREDPAWLLSKPLDLPKRPRPAESSSRGAAKGSRLSKQV